MGVNQPERLKVWLMVIGLETTNFDRNLFVFLFSRAESANRDLLFFFQGDLDLVAINVIDYECCNNILQFLALICKAICEVAIKLQSRRGEMCNVQCTLIDLSLQFPSTMFHKLVIMSSERIWL